MAGENEIRGTKNLGLIKAIHDGINPPLNTKIIWFDSNIGVKYHKVYDVATSTWVRLGGGGGGDVNLRYTVTKEQVTTLVDTAALIPGALYEITGVHLDLYNDGNDLGTTIYLRALSDSVLEKNGYGLFWNPPYDVSKNGFNIWNNEGTFTGVYDTLKTYSTLSSFCRHMLIDGLGNIFVSDVVNKTIIKIAPDGSKSVYGTTNGTPFRKVFDSAGNMFVGNPDDSSVTKITPGGVSTLFGYAGPNPTCVAVDSMGNVYCLNEGYAVVSRITPSGIAGNFYFLPNEFAGSFIVCDENDNLWIAYANKIFKVDTTGTLLFETPAVQVRGLVLQDGFLYATKAFEATILKINIDDNSITSYGNLPSSSNGEMTIDPDGNIYSFDYTSKAIFVVEPNGTTTGLPPVPYADWVTGLCFTNDKLYTLNGQVYEVAEVILDPIPFNTNEMVTSNNGATATLIGNMESGLIKIISGDWTVATSMTGNVTDAKARIVVQNASPFILNYRVIWGGYSWVNLNGNAGEPIDQFNLDSEWSKDSYDEDNYISSLDIIEYDYENDFIIKRYDPTGNINVSCPFVSSQDLNIDSPIKYMQFGNVLNYSFYKGIKDIKVYSSLFDCINFTGQSLLEINLDSMSKIDETIYNNNCSLSGLNLILSTLSSLTLKEGSSMSSIRMEGAFLNVVTINKNANIDSCSFLMNAQISDLTIPESGLLNSTIVESGVSAGPVNIDPNSILMLAGTGKTIFRRPDGNSRMRFYDDNDNLVVAELTDLQ